VEKGEKEVSPSPSIGLRALEASPSLFIGHQALDLPSLPSPFLEKNDSNH
jgi:hypothetical protein